MPALLGEPDAPEREYVFAEQVTDSSIGFGSTTKMMTMVRSRDWKLVHYLGWDQYGELYDLGEDPGEHRNLWTDPACQEKKREMLNVLLNWRLESGLKTRDYSIQWR
jgi:arylsulfatase A-like enzyme